MKAVTDAVGIVGSSFQYDLFTFVTDKGSYHCDRINMPSGFDVLDLDYYFADNVFQKATFKQVMTDIPDGVNVTIQAFDYGATKLDIPS